MGRKSNSKKENDSAKNFVSISLPDSPGNIKGRNITGLSRLVKDLSADIYNDIQHWNDLHILGYDKIKQICQIKNKKFSNLSEELEQLCYSLLQTVDALKLIKNSLKLNAQRLISSSQLHHSTNALFITWPIERFGEVAKQIFEAYDIEFKLKRKICENIAHSRNESELMFVAASWVTQPYIHDRIYILMESLLTETGHRE